MSTTLKPFGFHPPAVEDLAILFPQWEILSLIGRGGMGAVYKVRQPELDRIVALKILPAEVASSSGFEERFKREARALAKLHHPNIVMVFDFGQVQGQPYFIMEYVDGMTIRQLEVSGKLSSRQALLIVPQICEALQFAHDAGVVHRDIKPDNILVDKLGHVKIADFGIAKILGADDDPSVPVTQGAIGTPHYMAPEQMEKPGSVDHRADIFSLGVVFYEMLTGELPLGRFGPPSSGPRGLQVDVRLDEVVLRALERKPDLRYQQANHVKRAVETIANSQVGGEGGPRAPVQVPETLLARDYRLGIRNCIGRGWGLVKSDFWPVVGVTALYLILLQTSFLTLDEFGSGKKFARLGLGVAQILLAGPMTAGLSLFFLKKIRHEPATVDIVFSGFGQRFLHLFLASLVVNILVFAGFICLLLPGIYLQIAWKFALTLVIDKGMDFWPAMELSRKMITKHWWKMMLLSLTLWGIWILGIACCLIGLFVAAPISCAALMYAYEDVFGTWMSSGQKPLEAEANSFSYGPTGTRVLKVRLKS